MHSPDSRPSAAALADPLFLASLALLLANDLLLKGWFGNGLTGKLSDFAGLFAFPFFWAALLPRWRTGVYAATVVAFVVWKLPASDGLLAAWNAWSPLRLGRVTDPTDLIALTVLPLSFLASRRSRAIPVRAWQTAGISALSLFAFAATSYRSPVDFQEVYVYEGSREKLMDGLRKAGIETYPGDAYPGDVAAKADLDLQVPSDICFDHVDALVRATAEGSRTQVRLLGMTHRCPRFRGEERKLLEAFQAKVVKPLSLRPVP